MPQRILSNTIISSFYPFIYICRSWSDCENRKWTNWIFNEFKWRNWCWWQKQQYYIIYRSFDWTSLFSPSCYEKKQKGEKTSSICKAEGSFIIKNFDLYCLHDGMLSQVCKNSVIRKDIKWKKQSIWYFSAMKSLLAGVRAQK